MPKEVFHSWQGGERVAFDLRWAKDTDVSPGQVLLYLPPNADGVFEMIGNSGDTTELDRIIAALKRAKRAMLGTDTGVDAVVDSLSDEQRTADISIRRVHTDLSAVDTFTDADFQRQLDAHAEYDRIVALRAAEK